MSGGTAIKIGKKPTSIIVTPSAASKVVELLAEEEGTESLFLRVAVKPGGCSGFSYDMFFDSEIADDDIVSEVESEKGLFKVVVDASSLAHIKGSTLDYRDGLQGAGFHISNPNATRTCGCGSSFS